jgi:hypothetical protein
MPSPGSYFGITSGHAPSVTLPPTGTPLEFVAVCAVTVTAPVPSFVTAVVQWYANGFVGELK